MAGVRNPAENKALVEEIEALGRRALAVRMDLADLSGVRAANAEAHGISAASTSWSTMSALARRTRRKMCGKKISISP